MSNNDLFDDSEPTGSGIAGLNVVRQQGLGGMAGELPFTALWKSAPGFPFYMKADTSKKLIFLTEPVVKLGYPIIVKYNSGKNGQFADTIEVVSGAYDNAEAVKKGNDPFTVAFCDRDPSAYMFAVVFDRTPWEHKDKPGVLIPGSVRLWVTNNAKVQNQLDQIAKYQLGGKFTGAAFNVSRSAERNSARVGDSYTFLGKHFPMDQVRKSMGGQMCSIFDKFDMGTRLAYPGDELATKMVLHHKRMKDKQPNIEAYSYNADGVQAVQNGTWKSMASSDDMSELDDVLSGGGVTTTTTTDGGGLDFLDDLDEGTPEPEADDKPTVEPEEDNPFGDDEDAK